jgi:hypothetical protein
MTLAGRLSVGSNSTRQDVSLVKSWSTDDFSGRTVNSSTPSEMGKSPVIHLLSILNAPALSILLEA